MQTRKYGDWLAQWLGEQERYLKRPTWLNYRHAVDKHIMPELGEFQLGELTQEVMQETVMRWLEAGRCDGRGGLSDKTVRRLLGIVKLSLRAAARTGDYVMQDFDIRFPPPQEAPKLQVLTREEQALLTQHSYLYMNTKNLGILIALHTGLRIGELCGLQWGDIDLEERTLTVRRTVQRIYCREQAAQTGHTELLTGTPKTRSSVRTVPISTLLYPVLRRMDPGDPEAYVLTGRRKGTEPRTYRDYFHRLTERLGLPRIHFHGLRHTFATRLIEAGADYKTVSQLLGHASVNITLNLYVHPQMEQKRRAVELLNVCL